MSSSELDLSVAPSAEQIRKREFATVRRGYDADQVRDYLRQVADQIQSLEHEAHDAKASVAAAETAASDATAALQAALDRARTAEHDAREAKERLASAPPPPTAPEVDPYTAFGERMAETLKTAEAEAAEIRSAAEMESRRLEMEARAEADRITTDAQAHAEELRSQASQVMGRSQEEADRTLAGLLSKKESLRADLEHVRDSLLGMAQTLEGLDSLSPAEEVATPRAPVSADPFAPPPTEPADAAASPPPSAEPQSTEGESRDETAPRYFSPAQLKELWQDDPALIPEGGKVADVIVPPEVDEASAPADPSAPEDQVTPRYFSEEQLTELWQDDPSLLPEERLTEQIDDVMADASMDVSPQAMPSVEPSNPPPAPESSAASPFFVDETTRADEDPGSTGLYPR